MPDPGSLADTDSRSEMQSHLSESGDDLYGLEEQGIGA
jgi:hypothetical protein